MPTVKDVAELAGVSTATVSRTLSNPDKVQKGTRNKVLSAAKSLGYAPNAMARSLRRQESKTILVILPDIANPFFSEIIHGIENVAHREGYKILLGDAGHDITRATSYMELYSSKQVDGILLLTAEVAQEVFETEPEVEDLPVVMACEYFQNSTLPVVQIDNTNAAKHAVEYLQTLGHSAIATITGPMSNPICQARFEGFDLAMQTLGKPVEAHWVVEGDFTFQGGANAARTLLQSDHKPTAIFCQNDEMAIGVLNSAKEMNIAVPEDLSVVGFDNIEFSEYCNPPLTTVHQPRGQVGELAMKALLVRLQGKKPIQNQTLPTQFIVRQSASAAKE